MDCVVEATSDQSSGFAEQVVQPFAVLADGWDFLSGCLRNDTSQFGEDGLIQAALEKIGETNRWCFEVGAADGLFFSNTKRLRDAGWSAVLIEGDRNQAAKCEAFANHRVQVVSEKIGHQSLDNILSGTGAPIRLDLGVIDIDGQDYWAWDGLKAFRPRVMLVEFIYVGDPSFFPTLGGEGQAGKQAIIDMGISKGYTPLCHTLCNLLFVDNQCL